MVLILLLSPFTKPLVMRWSKQLTIPAASQVEAANSLAVYPSSNGEWVALLDVENLAACILPHSHICGARPGARPGFGI